MNSAHKKPLVLTAYALATMLGCSSQDPGESRAANASQASTASNSGSGGGGASGCNGCTFVDNCGWLCGGGGGSISWTQPPLWISSDGCTICFAPGTDVVLEMPGLTGRAGVDQYLPNGSLYGCTPWNSPTYGFSCGAIPFTYSAGGNATCALDKAAATQQ
jgi:hypothetical protein